MAAPAYRSSSTVFENSGTDAVLTVPAGTANGDYLLAYLYNVSGTPATPAGWTLLLTELDPWGSATTGLYLYGRSASSEPANYTWTGANFYLGIMVAYSHAQGVALEASAGDGSSSSSGMAAPSVTSGGADRRYVGYWGYPVLDTPVLPVGLTSRVVADNTTTVTHTIGDQTVGSGATGTKTATQAGGGFSSYVAASVVLRPQNTAPNAPTLSNPVGSSTFDRATPQRFAWSFSDPDFGDSQSGYDLRYQVVGSGTWTTVSGTTPNQFHDFAAATFAAGNYEWQARTYDAMGLVGSYSSSAFFTAATAPTGPTITAPTSGSTVSGTPGTLTWSITSQASYQIRRVADSGGSPDTGTVYSDTGEIVSTSARTASVSFPTNGRWEHVQLRTKDPTSGLWSSWASTRVNVSYTVGVPPVITATAVDVDGAIYVGILNPPQNLLTVNQASYETDLTGWAAGSNTTRSRSNTQAAHGSWSLRLNRSTGTGTVIATTPTGVSGIPISPSTIYTATAEFRPTTGSRDFEIYINWYTAAGAAVGTPSSGSFFGSSVGFEEAAAVGASPATAAFAAVEVRVLLTTSTTDYQYVDKIGLYRGTFDFPVWSVPIAGTLPDASYNDVYRRVAVGGSPDNDTPVGGDGIRIATGIDTFGFYADRAIKSGVTYQYKVRTVFTNQTTADSDWV